VAEIAENSLNVLALPLSITADRLHLLVFGKKRGFDHPRFLFLHMTHRQRLKILEYLIPIET
jgi:hypothetical protein